MTKHYADKQVANWNTNDVLAYLIAENDRRFGAVYTPMGRGSKSQRWAMERGMAKRAITQHGAEIVKRWLDEELAEYRSTTEYPALTFGFAYSFRDKSLARAAAQEAKRSKRAAGQSEELSVDEMIDLL